MKNLLNTFIIIALSQSTINAQYLGWAKQFNGSAGTFWDIGAAIDTDSQGNVYNAGYFQGTVDFDPGSGVSNLTSANQTDDIYICKLTAEGNLSWAKKFGSNDEDRAMAIQVDHEDNIYVAGYFHGNVDFDPGSGTAEISGDHDVFLLKLNSNGDFQWVKKFGDSSFALAQAIAVNDANEIVLSMSFMGNLDADPGSGVDLIENPGTAVALIKMDEQGEFQWSAPIIGTGVYVTEILFDGVGRLCSTGWVTANADMDPGAGTVSFLNPAGASFLQVLDTDGNLVWVKQFAGVNGNAQDMIMDEAGDFYFTGSFNFLSDFDPSAADFLMSAAGSQDVFILKLNAQGNFVWAQSMGGMQQDRAHALDLSNGQLFITGHFTSSADLQPGENETSFTSAGLHDIFVTSIATDGTFNWTVTCGGTMDEVAYDMVTDGNGAHYITGGFQGTADLDPTSGVQNFTSGGSYDIYMIRINELPASIGETAIPVIRAFPNPAQEMVQFVGCGKINLLEVFDATGNLVATETASTLLVNELPSGVYTVLVHTNEGMITSRFTRL